MKEKILDLAQEMFMDRGYLATSTRKIAKQLNIKQPALYHHYKNKEVLYYEVIKRLCLDMGDKLNENFNKYDTFEERLLNMSLVIQNQKAMNYALVMDDITKELSASKTKELLKLWKENYFQPFWNTFFQANLKLREGLELESVVRHYLLILTAFMKSHHEFFNAPDASVPTMINIFLKGIID